MIHFNGSIKGYRGTIVGKDTDCRFLTKLILIVWFIATTTNVLRAEEIHVRPGGMKPGDAIRSAKPGDSVILHPGKYSGGEWIIGVRGTTEKVITIRAADPKSPPVISGGLAGWQLSACSHLVIEDIVFQHQSDNGLNIDDNEQYQHGNLNAATDIRLNRIVVRELNADDNNDGIKLSGLRNFALNDCRISDWGKMGCAVDMVSCSDGKIVGIIADGRNKGGWGIQAKGGSDGLLINECQVINVTQRGIQVGGGTSPGSFREKGASWEAKNIVVQSCDVYGGDASIAIIHALDVSIQNCRWIHPKKWFFRFLNENNSPNFHASRNIFIRKNLCVASGSGFIGPVNSSANLRAESIQFEGNLWFHETFPSWDLRFGLPNGEKQGLSGIEPPGAFLRKDFVFTESRFEELRLLLVDEILQNDGNDRWNWMLISGLLLLMWFGLWVYSIGVKLESKSSAPMQRCSGSISRWLIFMSSLVFICLHFDLNLNQSDFEKGFVPVNEDRFEFLLRSIQLGSFVFLVSAIVDNTVTGFLNSHWVTVAFGCLTGIVIYGIEHLAKLQFGRIEMDYNHLMIDATVGIFGGVLAHGFSRDISAFSHKLWRNFGLLSKHDCLLWTLAIAALITSSISYPFAFKAEFLYDRFRSYGANLGEFAGPMEVYSLAESLLFCIPAAWATARIYVTSRGNRYRFLFILILIVTLQQWANFFRMGRYFLLTQTSLMVLLSLATWIFGSLTYRDTLRSTLGGNLPRGLIKHGWLFVAVPWVLIFWVSQNR
jgi:hypothetical protein